MPININPHLLQALRKHPVLRALHQLAQASHCAVYLVGGAVRDLLRGISPEKDFDVVTAENPKHLARLFSRSVSGTFVPLSEVPPNYRVVAHCQEQRIEVDFAAFRGKTLTEDLLLRDFSINAISLSLADLFDTEEPILLDPTGGIADLQAGVLRVTSVRSFDDDPLRVLRAVRIARMCHLSLHQDTMSEIVTKQKRLKGIAIERIRSEFFKAIEGPDAPTTMTLLEKLGILDTVMPLPFTTPFKPEASLQRRTMNNYDTIRQCEWLLNHLDCFCPEFADDIKTYCTGEIEADVHRFGLIKVAGLLHDQAFRLRLGSTNSSYRDAGSAMEPLSTLSTHFSVCFKLGKKASRSLQVMADQQKRLNYLFNSKNLSNRMCFRYFYDAGPEGIEAILFFLASIFRGDTSSGNQTIDQNVQKSAQRLLYYYYAEYCIVHPQPLISGQDIMEEFGLSEGKSIGKFLDRVGQLEAEGRLSTRDEALAWIRSTLDTSGELRVKSEE
ncbi:MAG TPA: hypothetical protein PLG17_00025 [Thermodesulfobacteriota bacterium]|nr:CCA tRNA nucleotidyltransferase [Deltaproteobacteria bacterium]HOC38555.1 hypothetical protein [Thermodesulfobacteriota bacterium]HQO76875.1 hypothetical protein [Thermodesulfobacteriota bacterium]